MKSTPAGRRWPYIVIAFVFALLLGLFPIPRQGSLFAAEGRLARLRGDNGAAAVAFEKAANLLPGHPELLEHAGLAAFDGRLYEKAAILLSQAREKSSLSPEALVSLGVAYQNTGQLDLALQAWEDAAGLTSKEAAIYKSLAGGYLQKGNLEKAATALACWLVLEPQSTDAAYQLGLVLAIIDPATAHEPLLLAGKLDADLVSKITRLEGGITAAGLEPDEAYRLTVTGQALGSIGEWRLAGLAFERALEVRSDYPEAWALLGEARQQLGGDGGEELKQALELNPRSFLALSLGAVRSLRRQEWQAAAGYLEAVILQDGENPRWHLELANAYAGLGELRKAYDSYGKAAALEPENPAIWRQIAAFSLSTGYEVEQVGFIAARQAVLLDENNAAGLDLLGQVYMVRKDLVSAERFFTRASTAEDNYPSAYLHLGILRRQQGRIPEAKQAFVRAVELAAGSQVGVQAQRLLDELGPASSEK